jgi:integrase
MIPTGKRLLQAQHPWLYLGNRSGLRTGEICGLRVADLGYLKERVIRVRYSYRGPLKEEKASVGKVKWAPADAEDFLGIC